MNMIEKVARAICDYKPTQPNQECPQACNKCIKQAKAAIEAMKEPSREMLNTNDLVAAIEMSKVYQAMIDAALKE